MCASCQDVTETAVSGASGKKRGTLCGPCRVSWGCCFSPRTPAGPSWSSGWPVTAPKAHDRDDRGGATGAARSQLSPGVPCPLPRVPAPTGPTGQAGRGCWGVSSTPPQPSARLGKQAEADRDFLLSFWQRRQGAQPFDVVTFWALAVCPATGVAQGHSGGPACPSPHGPHRTIPPQWAVCVETTPPSRHVQVCLMGCHSDGSQTSSNHTHGFAPSAGGPGACGHGGRVGPSEGQAEGSVPGLSLSC